MTSGPFSDLSQQQRGFFFHVTFLLVTLLGPHCRQGQVVTLSAGDPSSPAPAAHPPAHLLTYQEAAGPSPLLLPKQSSQPLHVDFCPYDSFQLDCSYCPNPAGKLLFNLGNLA